ncbi:hypothetical protein [Rhizorhabdus dicambivorans]|uniref:Lipoprotein n=1 Tax=Rhizorhabdus dicambivorans TaxID=1850238 RepID=A0A2A4FT78_9SPHN|nr:hypothetical protein [Rhizorhabdus dicambivorans]ATE64519.1 hypothetical protein CMV14_08995 [Rhizorhabdus dicambivorans]PCE41613.1 hypothetical protein COO09_13925 [Rhizorhabdus dicambivorans]
MLRIASALCVAFLVSGCAGVINSIADRPVTSDKYVSGRDSNKTQKVSGERRLIRVLEKVTYDNKDGQYVLKDGRPVPKYSQWVVCIEAHADAISARSSATAVTLAGKGAVQDAVTSGLLQTFTRTQASDVIRRLAWEACMAHANGIFSEADYREQLIKIIDNSFILLARLPNDPPPKVENKLIVGSSTTNQNAATLPLIPSTATPVIPGTAKP